MPNWRDDLPVHPAADLFPLMSEPELRELGEDIKANGLQFPVIVHDDQLLDGRNRLDAMTLVGIEFKIKRLETLIGGKRKIKDKDYPGVWVMESNGGVELPFSGAIGRGTIDDPYAYVVSANLHRRHLNSEQKRQLIADLLKANPEASDRQIAKQTNSSPSTVGAVRQEREASGDVSKLDTRTDSKGRKQPATKPKKTTAKLNGQDVDVSKLGPNAQATIAAAKKPSEKNNAPRAASKAPSGIESAPKTLSAEEVCKAISADALRDFKMACDTCLPRLNKADTQQARVFFNEWTAKAVKAEAKAKEAAA